MEARTPVRSTEQFPLAAIPGDYATGLRAPTDGLGPSGDFATGVRRATTTRSTGDFATGLRANADGAMRVGDFATGMRARDDARPATRSHTARGGLRRLQERTEPAS
jgi:hypothetical protein